MRSQSGTGDGKVVVESNKSNRVLPQIRYQHHRSSSGTGGGKVDVQKTLARRESFGMDDDLYEDDYMDYNEAADVLERAKRVFAHAQERLRQDRMLRRKD